MYSVRTRSFRRQDGTAARPRYNTWDNSNMTQLVRRRRRPPRTACFELTDPGIPGENYWCASQGRARILALRRAHRLGRGYRVLHHPRPRIGQPHYHIVDPRGNPFHGHFFYGPRRPRKERRYKRAARALEADRSGVETVQEMWRALP